MFILAHELGHALDNTLALKRIGAKGQLTAQQADVFGKAKAENRKLALQAAFGTEYIDDEQIEQIAAELGDRSLEDPEELIAQATAMWYYGEGDHPITDAVMNMLREEL